MMIRNEHSQCRGALLQLVPMRVGHKLALTPFDDRDPKSRLEGSTHFGNRKENTMCDSRDDKYSRDWKCRSPMCPGHSGASLPCPDLLPIRRCGILDCPGHYGTEKCPPVTFGFSCGYHGCPRKDLVPWEKCRNPLEIFDRF